MNVPLPKPISEMWRPELVCLPKLTRSRRAIRAIGYGLMKLIMKICLNISSEGIENIPQSGPLMIVINHLGNSDVPVLISSLPFPPDALAKIELYELPILGKLIDLYGVIWLHRGRADKRALRAALDGFAEGRVIVIAPEGRYSVTGTLEEGSGGAAFLAYKSGVAILPIAVTGTENENVYGHMKKFRRARVNIKVGKMFKLAGQAESDALPKDHRDYVSASQGRQDGVAQGTRQIMQALASLLPEKYRGTNLL